MKFSAVYLILVGLVAAAPHPAARPDSPQLADPAAFDRRQPAMKGEPPVEHLVRGIYAPDVPLATGTAVTGAAKPTGTAGKVLATGTAATGVVAATGTAGTAGTVGTGLSARATSVARYNFPQPSKPNARAVADPTPEAKAFWLQK